MEDKEFLLIIIVKPFILSIFKNKSLLLHAVCSNLLSGTMAPFGPLPPKYATGQIPCIKMLSKM